MQKFIFNAESLTSEQQAAYEAVETLCDKIRNHDRFSDADVARISSEIKEIHADYKKAFKAPAFSWQVEHYMIQMALENEFKFIFYYDEKMTWTPLRWEYALVTELGIRYYKQAAKGGGIVIPAHGLELMALWLFFQFFKANVLTGSQCMEVIEMAFEIVRDADAAISESIQVIKQWRKDNGDDIEFLNYQKTKWRREVAKYDRLIHGCMRLKEVEIHHIFYWCYQNWTFELNVRSASRHLGVSENGVKKILREHGFNETNLWGI